MDDYEKILLPLWNKTAVLPKTGAFTGLKSNEIITKFSRLTYILPLTTQTLIVIPPINGDTMKFMKALQTLDDLGMITGNMEIQRDVVVVCSSPFYGAMMDDTSHMKNYFLFTVALSLKKGNPDKFFVLSENTANNYATGTLFHTGRNLAGPGHNILPMLEPSYVIYPYKRMTLEGLLVSASVGGEPSLPNAKTGETGLAEIYGKYNFGQKTTLAYSPNLKAEASPGLFTIRSGTNKKIPQELSADCKGLLASYNLTERVEMFHPSRRLNSDFGNVLQVFRLQNGDLPLCKLQAVKELEEPQGPDKFYGSPEATMGGGNHKAPVKTYMAEVSGKIYNIRIPEFANGVRKDWLNGIYTDDEADFLNSMNLRPKMMDQIFPMSLDPKGGLVGVKWQEAVANFLQNMVTSQCFTDESLMTNRECMTSREFMNTVFNYFADKDLQSDTLHEYEDAAADDAMGQYKKARQDAESAKRHAAFRQPDAKEATDITSVDFSTQKKRWGTLEVYTDSIKGSQTAQVMLIDKQTGKQAYKSIAVPVSKYPKVQQAAEVLVKKIDEMKRKYPGFLFVY
jgi:hypothetical protein